MARWYARTTKRRSLAFWPSRAELVFSSALITQRGQPVGLRLRSPDRDLDPEYRMAWSGIDIDGAAMTFCDDPACDVQAEAGASGRVLGREKGLERAGCHIRWHSGAG